MLEKNLGRRELRHHQSGALKALAVTNPRSVRATLHDSVDNGAPPDDDSYEPDAPVDLSPPGTDVHEVGIHDGWPMAERCSTDREGFPLRVQDLLPVEAPALRQR